MVDTEYRVERDHLLEHIERELVADERVVAAWLAGSQGRSQADDISDIDVWVIVRDDSMAAVREHPSGFVQHIVPTIMEIHAPQNAPAGGAYLLTWVRGERGPQQVDWYWQGEREARRPANTMLLFERRSIPVAEPHPVLGARELEETISHWLRKTLLMAFITSKHARRGNQWVASQHMQHLATRSGTVEWLLDNRTMPDVKDPIRLELPPSVPGDESEQVRWVRATIDRLVERLSRERPGVLQAHERAVSQLNHWLERCDRRR